MEPYSVWGLHISSSDENAGLSVPNDASLKFYFTMEGKHEENNIYHRCFACFVADRLPECGK